MSGSSDMRWMRTMGSASETGGPVRTGESRPRKPGRPGLRSAAAGILLPGLAWFQLCLVLNPLVPLSWALGAFALALILGFRPRKFGVPLIIILPLLIRLVFLLFRRGMEFDNAWLLTWPWWYFTALSLRLSRRYPKWAAWAVLISLLFFAALMPFESGWLTLTDRLSLPTPALAGLKLIVGAVALVLAFLSLGLLFRPPPGDSRRHSVDRISLTVHLLILAVFFGLLLFGAARIQRQESLREGGGVLAGDLFHFDFNEVLSLEPEISLNGELTMLYREDGPPVPRYLRRFTLSGWDDDAGFFRDEERETDIPGAVPPPASLPRGPARWQSGSFEARTVIRQEYYLVALDPSSFFALNRPVRVEPWIIWDQASFNRAYGVDSEVSVAGPWELYDAGTAMDDPRWQEYYLQGGSDEAYRSLALETVGNAVRPWEQVRALESWFRENFYYSLEPGVAPDGDQLSWFLFNNRRGYCSYFAFAMTRMCRSLGIPARVAVGFLTDPDTGVLGFVPVRSDQAHAWVEVWFEDYGWIVFDPTSQTMAPGEEYPVQFINPDRWLPLVEEVLSRSGEVSVALPDEDELASSSWWRNLSSAVGRNRRMLAVGVPLLLLILFYMPRRILPGLVYFATRTSSGPRRNLIIGWRRFAGTLLRCGLGPSGKETPLDWACRLDRDGLSGMEEWTGLYLKAVYSPRFEQSDADAATAARAKCRLSIRTISRKRRLAAALGGGWRRLPW